MRRFDKIKLIKEANNRLEKEYLNSKNLITEVKDLTYNEIYKKFKTDYKLIGDDVTSTGIVPGTDGKYKITISLKNALPTYVITNATTNESLDSGTLKTDSKFLGMGTRVELNSNTLNKKYTLDNLMGKLLKQKDTDEETGPTSGTTIYSQLINKVNKRNYLTEKNGTVHYLFAQDKDATTYTMSFKPKNNIDQSVGEIKLFVKGYGDNCKYYDFNTKKTITGEYQYYGDYLKFGNIVKGTQSSLKTMINPFKGKTIDKSLNEIVDELKNNYDFDQIKQESCSTPPTNKK